MNKQLMLFAATVLISVIYKDSYAYQIPSGISDLKLRPHCTGSILSARAGIFSSSGRIYALKVPNIYNSASFVDAVKNQKIIVTYSSVKDHVCIRTVSSLGHKSLAAIIPGRFVKYVSYASKLDSWVGTWSDGPAKITVTRKGRSLFFDGVAYYAPQQHWGSFSFNAIPKYNFVSNVKGLRTANANDAATSIELNQSQCAIGIKKVYNVIYVVSNLACGGLNVTFFGKYHKVSSLRNHPAQPVSK